LRRRSPQGARSSKRACLERWSLRRLGHTCKSSTGPRNRARRGLLRVDSVRVAAIYDRGRSRPTRCRCCSHHSDSGADMFRAGDRGVRSTHTPVLEEEVRRWCSTVGASVPPGGSRLDGLVARGATRRERVAMDLGGVAIAFVLLDGSARNRARLALRSSRDSQADDVKCTTSSHSIAQLMVAGRALRKATPWR
jgi:hypothetical protein